jgi:hypothetical protein
MSYSARYRQLTAEPVGSLDAGRLRGTYQDFVLVAGSASGLTLIRHRNRSRAPESEGLAALGMNLLVIGCSGT